VFLRRVARKPIESAPSDREEIVAEVLAWDSSRAQPPVGDIPRMDVDRFLAPDLATAARLVREGTLLDALVAAVGAVE